MKTGKNGKLNGKLAEIAILLVAFSIAGWYIWPHILPGDNERNDYLVVHGAETICLALDRYSERHGGAYPTPDQLTGLTPAQAEKENAQPDVLLQEDLLHEYPTNPYSTDAAQPMKKVPFGKGAPGNFSYERDPDKSYMYRIVAYDQDGIVFEHEPKLF